MSNSALIDELFRCVDKIGYDKTLKGVIKLQFDEVKFEDIRVAEVVKLVSEKTEVPIYEIMFGNGRKNERKYAIGFCAYYLHSPEYFNMDMEQVQSSLNKGSTIICYKYSKDITRLNPKHPSDKKFVDIKSDLDVHFKKFLNKK